MALPAGKLKKVSNLPPVVLEVVSPPPEPIVFEGIDGKDGEDGRDAPTLEELVPELITNEVLRAALHKYIQEEIGRMIPEGLLVEQHRGGAGFHPQDLPGYKSAGANMYFGTNEEGKLGFWDAGNARLFVQDDTPVTDDEYLWVQTGLGIDGEDITFWVKED